MKKHALKALRVVAGIYLALFTFVEFNDLAPMRIQAMAFAGCPVFGKPIDIYTAPTRPYLELAPAGKLPLEQPLPVRAGSAAGLRVPNT